MNWHMHVHKDTKTMKELIDFAFSGFWSFIAFIILLGMILEFILKILQIIFKK
jgi:hypothetical protein